MTDPSDQPGAISAADSPMSPGQWLKQERERQGTTVQRIAADMHLSTTVIEAIEQNKFASLGAPVFAKGHLRKYASLLGLPVDRVFELYYKLEDAPREVDPVPVTQRAPEPALRPGIREMLSLSPDSVLRQPKVWPWIAGVAGLVVVILITWWLLGRGTPRHVDAKVESPREQIVSTPTPQEAETKPPPAAPPPALSATATPRPEARPMGTPPPGKIRIRLTFVRESWVEVNDADSNRILYQRGRADQQRTIDVEPPATVVLGDADAVTTEANGKLLSIPHKSGSGSARFTIGADGMVR